MRVAAQTQRDPARAVERAAEATSSGVDPGIRVSVVIPALNEARNLPRVLARLPENLFEVILVDGWSTDGTVGVAAALRPDIHVVKQSRKGKGNALACGFAVARGDVVVALDADGSTDPAEIPRFVQALVDGADYVKGSRFVDGGGSDDITRFRRLGNRGLNWLVNRLLRAAHTDLCYGYTAIWTKHLAAFRLEPQAAAPARGRLWGDGFEIETLMTLRAAAAGLKVVEVPSFESPRIHGRSNLNAVTDGLRVLAIIARSLWEDSIRRRRAVRRALAAIPAARAAPRAREVWTPMRLLDLDLCKPVPALAGGATPERGRVLVRVHGRPVGEVVLDIPTAGVPAGDLAAVVGTAASAGVQAHHVADGLEPPDRIGAAGLPPTPVVPACLARRQAVLAAPPGFTVVIATRDRPASLRRCLASVARLDYPRLDVLVVDSAPSDEATRNLVFELAAEMPWLRYICVRAPGLALAHNHALAHVETPWVAFTDDDVEIDGGWLAALAEATQAAPKVGCVTGLILPAEILTLAQELFERHGGFARGFEMRAHSRENPGGDPLFPYTAGRFGSGANMAFDVAALRRIGGFDVALGAGTPARGGDDLAAFVRIIRSGKTLVYQPDALIRHYHRQDYAALRPQVRGYGVGLGAYLASTVARDPLTFPEMVRRTVPAVRHLLAPGSPKNKGKGTEFPRELSRAELTGVLLGPFAYARSRWVYRGQATLAGPGDGIR